MAQKISQMTEQSTASMTEAGTSDFLGGYTATGGNANRKFSLSGLANYFLNKFKMTLGGSSQTVKSAIDALNSNIANLPYAKQGYLSGAYDFNDIKSNGFYWCIIIDGNVVQNYPSIYNGILMVFTNDGSQVVQMFIDRSGAQVYVRQFNSNTWGDWNRLARAT